MSYILDALKKSEKERSRGTVPDVLTIQEPVAYDRKKRNILLSLIAVALLLNAGVLIWWLAFSPGKKEVPGKTDAVRAIVQGAQETNPKDRASFPAQASGTAGDGTKTLTGDTRPPVVKADDRSLRERHPPQVVNEKDKAGISLRNKEKDRVPATKDPREQDVVAHFSSPSEGIPKPDPKKLYLLRELPEGIRKELPPLSLSIALYSDDPATRIARIDGQSLREGQELAPGLKLEQIIEHAVILSYRNYRFRIGIQ